MFPEPRYIGMAKAKNLTGPYKAHPRPVISADPECQYHNIGAGAINVLADKGRGFLWGFNNGIFILQCT